MSFAVAKTVGITNITRSLHSQPLLCVLPAGLLLAVMLLLLFVVVLL